MWKYDNVDEALKNRYMIGYNDSFEEFYLFHSISKENVERRQWCFKV